MKPTKRAGERVVTYLPMEYDPTPPPPLKLRSLQPPAGDWYDQIESIDAHKGVTHWKDGTYSRWQGVSRRATFDPQVRPSPDWIKRRARVQAYWGSHPYECQVCGLDRDKDGFLQRPINVNDGPIKLHLATGSFEPGDEPDNELLALCDSCAKETSELAHEHGSQNWGPLVLRLQGKRKLKERRRRDLITQQRQDREILRTRKLEWRAEIDRRKEAGEVLDAEFRSEYADVYTLKPVG